MFILPICATITDNWSHFCVLHLRLDRFVLPQNTSGRKALDSSRANRNRLHSITSLDARPSD